MLRSLRPGTTARLLVAAIAMLGICRGQSIFSSDAAAKLIRQTGQVSVLRDSVPWALSLGDTIRVQQVIVTGPDGFAIFEVSDGSTFEVYPNSRVTFRNNPGNLRDLLDLWMGRVKVHIQKLGGTQPNPNRVRTPTAVISVRGTIFDVVLEDDLDTTLVSVEEGQVAVQHALLPRGEAKLVNAGEYLRIYKNQPLAQRTIDKGSVVQRALQSAADALYTIIYRNPGGGSPIPGAGSGGSTGDTQTDPPPPPPPPTDAPPPPPAQ